MAGGQVWVRVGVFGCALVFLNSGCSALGTEAPSAAEFEQKLVERFNIERSEAACVTGYVFDEYDAEEIVNLDRSGMTGVGPERWSGYGQALFACTIGPELIGGPGGT